MVSGIPPQSDSGAEARGVGVAFFVRFRERLILAPMTFDHENRKRASLPIQIRQMLLKCIMSCGKYSL